MGAVVAIMGERGSEEVLLRRRMVIIDSKIAGSAQPYNYVANKEISAAENLPAARPSLNNSLLNHSLNARLNLHR